MPAFRQLPDGQSFSAYKDAVQIRLAPHHHFSRRLQLKKNPHQQDVWTNWLEYLSYEKMVFGVVDCHWRISGAAIPRILEAARRKGAG